ncbi:hypothetical protein SDC9_175974 [bioreactor metagenome]|uniref:Uncharacterized protein n=1 Tax=bioreactor metagenome TaxID=1076179 RepID=A0A645GRF8_9ZZZZ
MNIPSYVNLCYISIIPLNGSSVKRIPGKDMGRKEGICCDKGKIYNTSSINDKIHMDNKGNVVLATFPLEEEHHDFLDRNSLECGHLAGV